MFCIQRLESRENMSVPLSGFYAEMFIGSIDKLNHEMTSYKTRQSSYGNPTGCMKETRVKILED